MTEYYYAVIEATETRSHGKRTKLGRVLDMHPLDWTISKKSEDEYYHGYVVLFYTEIDYDIYEKHMEERWSG
jgi:hypothetical protein